MFRFCIKYISKYKNKVIVYLLLSIMTTLITVSTPLFWGRIIDIITTSSDIKKLINLGIIVSILCFVKVLVNYLNNKLYIIIQTNTAIDMSSDIIHHLHKTSLSVLQKYDAGYLNESINHDSNSIIIFFLSILTGVLSNGLLSIFSLCMLFVISYKIAILLLLFIVLYIIVYILFKQKLNDRSRIFKEAQSVFFADLLEQFKNVKFIKQHALEKFYNEKLNKAFEVFFKKALKAQQFFFLYSSIDQILEIIVNFCIYVLGGIFVIQGDITIGAFTILLNYYRNMRSSLTYFVDLGKEYQNNKVSFIRMTSFWDIKEQSNGNTELKNIERISCENLSFKREEKIIINSFNYVFEKGKIYRIKGENGAGKTTLIDLIMGLYIDEFSGKIQYNDINIQDIDMRKLRYFKISMLEQNPYILKGKVESNIHLTNQHRSNKFSYKIMTKKLGNIKENGDGVSGGERQKMGIMRMLAKNADVIFLDEPTSALDQESKIRLYNLLDEMKKDKIILIVSHDNEITNYVDYTVNL